MSVTIRTLGPGDEEAFEAFLSSRADTSMFLRSNALAVGFVDRDAPYHGTYVGAFDAARMVGVAAQYWNGMVMVQAEPPLLDELVREVVRRSGRPVSGFSGAFEPCVRARTALGLDERPMARCEREDLFALALGDLVVPDALERGEVTCRRATRADVEALVPWRVDYCVETMGREGSTRLVADAPASVERTIRAGVAFVLEHEGRLVANSNFNARVPGVVQIGGVWTPPSLRGRGYARAVVAGSLRIARSEGVTRSILFTGQDHEAAQKAYRSIGYRVVGDYALMLF